MEWVFAAVIVIVGIGGMIYAWHKVKVFRVLADARLLIEEYRARCNEVNRFVINKEEFSKIYPTAGEAVIREVWTRLVNEKVIDRDPLDGEWCIRK